MMKVISHTSFLSLELVVFQEQEGWLSKQKTRQKNNPYAPKKLSKVMRLRNAKA